jgi:hypothetical protein
VELHRWGFSQGKSLTLDAEDVEITRIIRDITDVQAVVSQMQEFENILGLNGTPKWN